MTEDEAREKWCPKVQVTSAQHMNDIEYGDNRGGGDDNHNCIASDCMMWVATDNECQPQPHPKSLKESETPDPICHPAGYCGLTRR